MEVAREGGGESGMERVRTWLGRVEAKLDEYGRPGWLAAMVVGFILFWPIGLGILGYMLWSGRMGCWGKSERRARRWSAKHAAGSTGNAAFDAYREETLRRLEDEREAFAAFLERLRHAKDQAEFDQFMSERSRADTAPDTPSSTPMGGAPV